ncbi:hypothetical protein Mpt1_c09900 [Candidatus Methanoplasma termitum]|uniref:Uncharacterized protein n=2 Tax=Candidatus Methanoplasma termitum TaxID=1577791 RepID=A0A0A7LCR8_9ARCH|nr:hypothetical protein Mpt1_c09900 [Candidatus Methanoplasma termitum]
MQKWTVNHNWDKISVEKRRNKCTLYINGKEVDSQGGPLGGSLIGKTPSGETVTATINSGFFGRTYCNIYINDVKIFMN